jgi:hypothetical protein
MALDQQQLMKMLGMGTLGAGLGGLFGGGKNPADAANKYLNQIPGQAGQYLQPYMNAGQGALPGLQDQYNSLLGSPGDKLNDIGKNYQQSPGFKFALDQALSAGNRSSAAGGMAGSPAAQQQNMATASGLASQDYNNWMSNALGLYGQGLTGQQGLAQMGQQAGQNMSDLIAQQLAQQAQLGYAGQASKNQSNPWGNILGGLGSLAGIFF